MIIRYIDNRPFKFANIRLEVNRVKNLDVQLLFSIDTHLIIVQFSLDFVHVLLKKNA